MPAHLLFLDARLLFLDAHLHCLGAPPGKIDDFLTRFFRDLRVRDETPSIRRRELISISVEVLRSYGDHPFDLEGRGTVRDNNNNTTGIRRAGGPVPSSRPGKFA